MKVPDLNGRTSAADEANRTYVGDITDLPLVDGTFRCFATVTDLCSRRLAGWAIADSKRADLVVDALKAAERTRGSLAGAVMHTDQGAQYRSDSSKRLSWPQSVHSPQCGHGVRTTAPDWRSGAAITGFSKANPLAVADSSRLSQRARNPVCDPPRPPLGMPGPVSFGPYFMNWPLRYCDRISLSRT
ncbi:DDE-type integrase/transposase/recombinase [Streptomyces olivaceoviridis]|uniref:DDE-type integrase/transposase/recombinase n=1 Tax=Streptomyces olivaceoviridis TaxID=1921 RepID=UPI0036CE4C0B